MRTWVIAALASACALGAACKGDGGRGDGAAQARAASGAPRPPTDGSEQARFDRERHPELIVAALGLHPGAVVADVGAGTGLLTVHLARAVSPGGKVVATDVDGAVLELMTPRLDAAGLTAAVERRVVSADAPGLEAGAYDAILLAHVDHFFADRAAWLRAAVPALKPGGVIVIANRTYHRGDALAGAAAAGLHLARESNEIPGEFIATFTADAPAPAPRSP